MNNIEIKAVSPPVERLSETLAAMQARREWIRAQRDVFFQVPQGYLKLRTEDARDEGDLIAYDREPGFEPRVSDYEIVPVPRPGLLEAALTRSLGVRGIVEKTRTLFLWRHTRVHLDEVRGLGSFLELETVVRGISRDEAQDETREVMKTLGIPRESLLDRPYLELLEAGGTTAFPTGS